MLIGITQQNDKLGICRGKRGLEQHCHSEPVRTLVWESPSNSRQLIVIQTVVFVPFSGILPREVVRLTGGLPRQCAHWLAMTGNSTNSNLPRHRTIPSGSGWERLRTTPVTTWLSALPTNSNLYICGIRPICTFYYPGNIGHQKGIYHESEGITAQRAALLAQ